MLQKVVVSAGSLADVVNEALSQLDMPEGRYTITVDWPFEEK